MEECSETRIQGRLGWKARPLAREDLDSNLVSMGAVEAMVVEGERAVGAIGREPQLRQALAGSRWL